MPVIPHSTVVIEPRYGKQATVIDGISLTVNASSESHKAYTVPENLHLDEIILIWKDFEDGDLGWLRLIHPGSQGSPVGITGADVDVGGLSPYYNGALAMEFWNAAETVLEEVVPIASLSGNIVTLTAVPISSAASKIKARYQNFHPVRGTMGLSGGFRLLGAGLIALGAPNEQTDQLTAGLLLYVGIKTAGGGATRHFATNFVFRKPNIE